MDDVERVAAFLHDEYGCRITCRGGRLADDRHPSHNEAYRGQAERLLAACSLTGSGLDVERLARAQVRSGIDTFLPGEDRWISANEAQAAIAREYAALSGESGEPTR